VTQAAPARAIEHITLTTGAARVSPRSDVDDSIVARLIAAMRTGGRLWDGWSVAVTPQQPGAWRFRLSQPGLLVVECWLCGRADASDPLWEAATSGPALDERVVLYRPRGVPWLAVSITAEAVQAATAGRLSTQHLMDAGDAERCIAWAILNREGMA
jgi:hypothetical protein